MTTKERLVRLAAGFAEQSKMAASWDAIGVLSPKPCNGCGRPSSCRSCPDCLRLVAQTLQSAAQGDAGWRPIETAPKDGTLLLLFGEGDYEDFILVGCYSDTPRLSASHRWTWGITIPPTHWQPLPPPPTQAEE